MGDEYLLSGDVRGPLDPPRGTLIAFCWFATNFLPLRLEGTNKNDDDF